MYTIAGKVKNLVDEGFFHILIGNTLNKMIAFISSIVIVRLVEKAQYGYLAYADNLYAYVNLFAGLGLSSAILKYCGKNKSTEENRYFLGIALKYGPLVQMVLSLPVIVYVSFFNSPFPKARSLVYLLFLYPFLVQIMTTTQNYLRSQLQNKLFAKIGIAQSMIVFLFSIILTVKLGVSGVVVARYIALAASIGFGMRFILRRPSGQFSKVEIPLKIKKGFWAMAISLMFANMLSMIMPLNEMFMINNLIKNELVTASYKVAILIPSQILFVVDSIIIYMFPRIAQMSEDGGVVFSTILKFSLMNAGIIFCIMLIGIVFNPFIIQVIYGSNYKDAIPLSLIFWIVNGLNAGFRMIPMNMLPALGVTTVNVLISVVSSIVHIVLSYLFISNMGIKGAAYAVLIVYLLSGTVYWGYLNHICRNKEEK